MSDGCPNARTHWLDPRTGERRPRSCRRLGCPHCGPRLALSTANAIALATPRWSGVLTLWGSEVPADPGALFRLFVPTVNAVVAKLRERSRTLEHCWVLELSPTGIPNAHVLMWGTSLSRSEFRRAALHAGMRWGDVQQVRHLSLLARYVLKLPLAPLDLGLDGSACMDLHLALNGGRLLHSSRRFWRDGSRRPLPGVRAAREEARRARVARGTLPMPADLAEWRRGRGLPFDRLPSVERGRT